MPHYLLIGAGFTRNWGGPLSSEVNGSLLGDLHDDPVLSKRLREEPFESVFEGFNNPAAKPSERQQRFQDAVVNLFQRLNLALLNKPFEFCDPPTVEYQVGRFLAHFDAIFSLNQDLLLECHYHERFMPSPKWGGAVVAGMRPELISPDDHYGALNKIWVPTGDFNLPRNMQPLVKLHGSTNWRAGFAQPIMVMGNEKSGAIKSFPVLGLCHDFFVNALNQPNAKLMVIGYSFQDRHINAVIEKASTAHGLGTFIMDPIGSRVLDDKNPRMVNATIGKSSRPVVEIKLIGELHRPLSTVLSGKDQFAFKELMRFFH